MPGHDPCLVPVQEDGLKRAVEAFHAHLPLEQMQGPGCLEWHLAKPHFTNIISETGRGVLGVITEPVRGYRDGGDCLLPLHVAALNIMLCRGQGLTA